MSPSDSSMTADTDSDPSIEIEGSDVDANATEEDPEEEEEEVQEEEEMEEEEEEEEVEEEEIEVEEEEEEEEEEVEEEEEEEVEEEEEEDKGAVSNSQVDADKDRKDLSQHIESKRREGNLRPVSSVSENPEVMPPSSMHSIEENDATLKVSVPSCETLTLKKEDFHLKHEISSCPKSRKELASVEDDKNQGLDVDIENAGSLLQSKAFGACSEPSCNNKAYLCGIKDMDSATTKSSSDPGKDVAMGLLQRGCFVKDADDGQNSRNEIMLLEMESRDDVKQMTSRTRSLSPSADKKDGNKRPAIICDFFAKGWCIRGSSCRFLHIKDPVNNTGQEAEGDLVTANRKKELELEKGVRDNVDRSRMASTPFTASLESTSLHSSEFPLKQSMQNGQEASPSGHPSQEKQKFPLPPKGDLSSVTPTLPNCQGSFTLRDSVFPENRFAFNASDKYFSTNLSSYSTRAEGMATIRNQHMYNGYKSKICSYDWEPSVPFRPSFFITSMSISSSGDLYDPLRDSVEIPNIGDGSLKASILIHGSSIQASSQVRTYGDSAVAGKHEPDLNEDKSSVSSHNRFCENEPNKSCVHHEKDCLEIETETTSGTYLNYQNGKMGMGKHTFGVEDGTKAEKERTERDARHQGEGSGHRKKRVDRDKKNNEMDVDFQMEGSMLKETKALRNFRAALVDLVKELLKPSWHEGRLSKDAHVMIVKKSVDKVLSTLEPHQIPTTIDTAKHYVSSCRMKIAKLVNGYVNKYGKS